MSSCACYGSGTINCYFCNFGIKWGYEREKRRDSFLYGYRDINQCHYCHGSGRLPSTMCDKPKK